MFTTRRAPDAKCPTCGNTCPVTEITDVRSVERTVWVGPGERYTRRSVPETKTDRTFHCTGHVYLEREFSLEGVVTSKRPL